MKIVIFGANGFLGSEVLRQLLAAGHQAVAAINDVSGARVDMLDRGAIIACLQREQPNVVINCAGIVDNSDLAAKNSVFSGNLLKGIHQSGITALQQLIITGSAAEYGELSASDLPVNEDAPLNAQSMYGLSKFEETRQTLELGAEYGITVIVARMFNLIGIGMQPKFLIRQLVRQVVEIKRHERTTLEVSRADSKRDFVDIRDAAAAMVMLAEHRPKQKVYNVGSGISTSNAELISMVIACAKLDHVPPIRETADQPEPLLAIQADISRLTNEFAWRPVHRLEDTVKDIMND